MKKEILDINLSNISIGKITQVSDNIIFKLDSKFVNGLVNSYQGLKKIPTVGEFIKIDCTDKYIIAKIIKVEAREEKKSAFDRADSINIFSQVFICSIQGEINKKESTFRNSFESSPDLFSRVFLLSDKDIKSIYKSEFQNNKIPFGKMKFSKTIFFPKLTPFLSSHMLIIGNTGSGKSWTTKKIAEVIATNNFFPKINFFLIDTNGEYLIQDNSSIFYFQENDGFEESIYSRLSNNSSDIYTLSEEQIKEIKSKITNIKINFNALKKDDWESLFSCNSETEIYLNSYIFEKYFNLLKEYNLSNFITVIKDFLIDFFKKSKNSNKDNFMLLEIKNNIEKLFNIFVSFIVKDEINIKKLNHEINILINIWEFLKGLTVINNDYRITSENFAKLNSNPDKIGLSMVSPTGRPVTWSISDEEKFINFLFRKFDFNKIKKEKLDNNSFLYFYIFFEFYRLIIIVSSNINRDNYINYFQNFQNLFSKDIENIYSNYSNKNSFFNFIYSEGNNSIIDHDILNENTIINFQDISYNNKKLLVNLFINYIYRERIKNRKNDQNLFYFIIDEAHNYIQKNSEYDIIQNSINKIAKEGRKFYTYLLISSQSPSDLSKTLISQCENIFIHRLNNNDDINALSGKINYFDLELKERIKLLPKGSCLISGDLINVSSIVDILSPVNPPFSSVKEIRLISEE